MHSLFYNDLTLSLEIRPITPLLIKSGEMGTHALDPTLPDMSFVRTKRPGAVTEEIYLPGASVRGVLRSHAERLIRSAYPDKACDPLAMSGGGRRQGGLRASCAANKASDLAGPKAYLDSCYACRIFGNTILAGRVRVTDFYVASNNGTAGQPLTTIRYGVAIDRVTGAVAQGPFELEVVTDGRFVGTVTMRNFTLGQLGVLAASLLDMADGLVPLGYGKSRGLGRVQVTVSQFMLRTLKDPRGSLMGVGALCDDPTVRQVYQLPQAEQDELPVQAKPIRQRGFWTLQSQGDLARQWLEQVAPKWLQEAAA